MLLNLFPGGLEPGGWISLFQDVSHCQKLFQGSQQRILIMAWSIDDEDVIRLVLFDTYPPTNPAVLLRAAREWYLRFGADDVLREVLSRLMTVCNLDSVLNMERYHRAQAIFNLQIASSPSGSS